MRAVNDSPLIREFVTFGKSETCPIIDMHAHPGPFHGSYLPHASVQGMLHTMERAGVTRIVCCPSEALMADPDMGNAVMQRTIDHHPQFLGYWGVNPNHPDAIRRAIADFEKARGFIGFKLLPDYHTCPVTSDRYTPVLEHADSHRLVNLIHTWGYSAYNSPQMIEQVATKYPDAIFLMGHSGYGDFEAAVRVAAEHPNVYLELTAVYVAHDFGMFPTGSGTPVPIGSCLQVNGVIEHMVEHATSRKIVFGTDLPWYSPHYAAGAVLFARIDDEARRDILHGNAQRLLENSVVSPGSL